MEAVLDSVNPRGAVQEHEEGEEEEEEWGTS